MAPSQPLRRRGDPFDSPAAAVQQTREAPGTEDSFGDTTWAVVAIVLGAFLMVTLVIFSVLYYLRWRQLARAAATAAATTPSPRGGDDGGGGGDDQHRRPPHPWADPAPADAQLRHHRSRLRLDPAAAMVGSLAAAGPRRLRKMTSEDQAEAHELERALMIRKSLASRESWGSHASHHTLISNNNNNNHGRSVSGGSNNSNNSSSSSQAPDNNGSNGSGSGNTHETDGHGAPATRHRSHDSLKSWEAAADGSRRASRVVLPAASAESLRGHPALEAAAPSPAGPRTSSLPAAPAGLQRKLMSPLPPLPDAHTR